MVGLQDNFDLSVSSSSVLCCVLSGACHRLDVLYGEWYVCYSCCVEAGSKSGSTVLDFGTSALKTWTAYRTMQVPSKKGLHTTYQFRGLVEFLYYSAIIVLLQLKLFLVEHAKEFFNLLTHFANLSRQLPSNESISI